MEKFLVKVSSPSEWRMPLFPQWAGHFTISEECLQAILQRQHVDGANTRGFRYLNHVPYSMLYPSGWRITLSVIGDFRLLLNSRMIRYTVANLVADNDRFHCNGHIDKSTTSDFWCHCLMIGIASFLNNAIYFRFMHVQWSHLLQALHPYSWLPADTRTRSLCGHLY